MSNTAYAGIATACFLGICVCIGIATFWITHPKGQHHYMRGESHLATVSDDPDFGDDDEDFTDDDEEYDDEDDEYDDDDDTEFTSSDATMVSIYADVAQWQAYIDTEELATTPWIPARLRKKAA